MMSPNYLLASEAAKGNVCRMLRQTQKDFAAFSKLYCQHTHTTTLGLKNQAKSPETASKQASREEKKAINMENEGKAAARTRCWISL